MWRRPPNPRKNTSHDFCTNLLWANCWESCTRVVRAPRAPDVFEFLLSAYEYRNLSQVSGREYVHPHSMSRNVSHVLESACFQRRQLACGRLGIHVQVPARTAAHTCNYVGKGLLLRGVAQTRVLFRAVLSAHWRTSKWTG